MHDQFQKDKPSSNAICPIPIKAEARLSKRRKTRDNKKQIGKQHADTEEGEKEKETKREKKVIFFN